MTMPPKRNISKERRKISSLLIEPFKQVKFGLVLLAVSTFFLIVLAYFILEAFNAQYAQLMELYQVTDEGSRYALITNDLFKRHMIQLGLVYFVYMLVFFSLVIKLTHRFYGPTLAISRFVSQMKQGNYAYRLSLRKTDELQSVAQELNSLAEDLERRHGGGKS